MNNIERIKTKLKLQKLLFNTEGLYLGTRLNNFGNKMNKTKKELLEELKKEVERCQRCDLCKTRIKTVFGEGDSDAKLMFVGEGPGYEEDKQGRPFVGVAGELLTKIILAMGLTREKVYIANIVKCHPLKIPDPYLRNNDRPPNKQEIENCLPFLKKQIMIIRPRIICCLGSTATSVLTKREEPISELRGKIFKYEENNGIEIIPTYHPAALLRNPSLKPLVWKDMKVIMKILGLK
jgi:uracil-DNA glycosylase family 4